MFIEVEYFHRSMNFLIPEQLRDSYEFETKTVIINRESIDILYPLLRDSYIKDLTKKNNLYSSLKLRDSIILYLHEDSYNKLRDCLLDINEKSIPEFKGGFIDNGSKVLSDLERVANFDKNPPSLIEIKSQKMMIRNNASLMITGYNSLGKRDTEWEKEYFKGIVSLVDDIMKLTDETL